MPRRLLDRHRGPPPRRRRRLADLPRRRRRVLQRGDVLDQPVELRRGRLRRDVVAAAGNQGLFSTSADNPVGDYNMVYVPYCTGDLHGGSFPASPGLISQGVEGLQQFVGHQNVERALALLDEGLDAPGKVLLTGSSAGGFGTLLNFGAVADTFTDSDLFLVDDSGPMFFADNVLSPPAGRRRQRSSTTALGGPAGRAPAVPAGPAPGHLQLLRRPVPERDVRAGELPRRRRDPAVLRVRPGAGRPDHERRVRGRPARRPRPDLGATGARTSPRATPTRSCSSRAGTAGPRPASRSTTGSRGILSGTPTNVDPALAARAALASR